MTASALCEAWQDFNCDEIVCQLEVERNGERVSIRSIVSWQFGTSGSSIKFKTLTAMMPSLAHCVECEILHGLIRYPVEARCARRGKTSNCDEIVCQLEVERNERVPIRSIVSW